MEYGVCPVCDGTGQVALTDEDKKWSWNKGRTPERQIYGADTSELKRLPKQLAREMADIFAYV